MTSLKERALSGYVTEISLSEYELGVLRDIVSSAWLEIIRSAGIEKYGLHKELFQKSSRVFRIGEVNAVKRMGIMTRLHDEIGDFKISDVVLPGGEIENREEIYWRIVRPNCPDDVGPRHRDKEFHKKYGIQEGHRSIKCWIPLYCEPGCGLRMDDGVIISTPGTVLMFGDETPHQGMINTGSTARVSVEITLVLP